MRDFQTKSNVGATPDSNSATKYGGGEATSLRTEAKEAVERAGLTLAPQDGTGEDTTQLAQALFINAVSANTFQDGGVADAIVLTPVSGSTGLTLPPDYTTLDGAEISFFPAFANLTTTPTASIGQTGGTQFGAKTIVRESGAALSIGDLSPSVLTTIKRDDAGDEWLLIRGVNIPSANLPQGYWHGLTMSNGGDPLHDIDFASGVARDFADTFDFVNPSIFTKQIDAVWAAGTNAGGLASGDHPVQAGTWYHSFIVDDGAGGFDFGFDTSPVAAQLLADTGGSKYFRRESIKTDGSADILKFKQAGDWTRWETKIQSYTDGAPGTAAVSVPLDTPPDFVTKAQIIHLLTDAATVAINISALNEADIAPVAFSNATTFVGNAGEFNTVELELPTNTLSQIRLRSSLGSGIGNNRIYTIGWYRISGVS